MSVRAREEYAEFLTTADVAKRLGVTDRTVRNWINEQRVHAIKIGAREWRIPIWALERFLYSGRW
ncbi:helix-turn-helix domain-containing protein [Caenispirillum salinarum]|uniref:helix-turn-helix domain-containing protein n=1 Tax=Caenispirillum salinarum TaxID=859058 RepID=UPI00384BC994